LKRGACDTSARRHPDRADADGIATQRLAARDIEWDGDDVQSSCACSYVRNVWQRDKRVSIAYYGKSICHGDTFVPVSG
jgi:hypothetical protein